MPTLVEIGPSNTSLPLRSVGRSNFDNGLSELVQNRSFYEEQNLRVHESKVKVFLFSVVRHRLHFAPYGTSTFRTHDLRVLIGVTDYDHLYWSQLFFVDWPVF